MDDFERMMRLRAKMSEWANSYRREESKHLSRLFYLEVVLSTAFVVLGLIILALIVAEAFNG